MMDALLHEREIVIVSADLIDDASIATTCVRGRRVESVEKKFFPRAFHFP